MKIRPVILCGGEGTRLWSKSKTNEAKQFINFGGWTLFEKTLERVNNSLFDYPIISTNIKYLKNVKFFLKKRGFKKYKIILEPSKKNTAPAILTSSLLTLKDNKWEQPLIFLSSDHLIEKKHIFYREIKKNINKLDSKNIFIFGAKPTFPSVQYGYFLTKKIKKNINKVSKFIEKPNHFNAKKIIRRNGYWNTGIFLLKTQSIIHNFLKYSPKIYHSTIKAVSGASKTKIHNNTWYIDKNLFEKISPESFDYAILEKAKYINAIKLNIPWSDLGNWKEILKFYYQNKSKYFKKKNVYHRPWGRYVNLFEGKKFLIKELTINSKSSISLQKHHHRSEHWMVIQGKPKITINKKKFFKKENDSIFVPSGTIHRIENLYKKPVKIMEAQIGNVLKESDIVRYKDVYGRVK